MKKILKNIRIFLEVQIWRFKKKPEDVIPSGLYCYNLVENGRVVGTKYCPYFRKLSGDTLSGGACLKLNYYGKNDFILGDACKVCSIKY